MKRGWLVWGWLLAVLAAALPALWSTAEKIEANPLGKYVDPLTGAWTARVFWHFLYYWLPIAAPVSLLAFACMFLNRPRDPR